MSLASPSSSSYVLLDAGRGERLEQWGPYRLRRPDAQATMGRALPAEQWSRIDAHYRGEAGHGHWERHADLPERWTIAHGGLTLVVKLAPFKHTGVFPEQSANWRWMAAAATAAAGGRPITVLNLFAYTGGASMALARAGHRVTHVDASKPALAWARENAAANDLPADAIRWIQDDAAAFVRREIRRARRYDAVILDPPAFGRTPDGKIWRVRDHLAPLLDDLMSLLAEPLFLVVNDYSRDADHKTLAEQVQLSFGAHAVRGHLEAGHLTLPLPAGRSLDTGTFVRWRATSSARR